MCTVFYKGTVLQSNCWYWKITLTFGSHDVTVFYPNRVEMSSIIKGLL